MLGFGSVCWSIARWSLVVGALAGLSLLASGCGGSRGPSVAGVGTASSSAVSSTSTAGGGASTGSVAPGVSSSTLLADQLAYAKCMRSNGVPNFPDPSRQGGFGSSGSGSSIDHDSPQFIAANSACRHLLPSAGPTQAQNEQRAEQTLKFARCMRSHDISGFPDSMQITGQGDLNPDNPQFQAAQKACQALQPGRHAG